MACLNGDEAVSDRCVAFGATRIQCLICDQTPACIIAHMCGPPTFLGVRPRKVCTGNWRAAVG